MNWQNTIDAILKSRDLNNEQVAQLVTVAGGRASREAVRKWRAGRLPDRRNLIALFLGLSLNQIERDQMLRAWLEVAQKRPIEVEKKPVVVVAVAGAVMDDDQMAPLQIDAVVLNRHRESVGEFSQKIKPSTRNAAVKNAISIAGLNSKTLNSAPTVDSIIPVFKGFIESHQFPTFLAWNVPLTSQIFNNSCDFIYPNWVDVAEIAFSKFGSRSLDGVALRSGINEPKPLIENLVQIVRFLEI